MAALRVRERPSAYFVRAIAQAAFLPDLENYALVRQVLLKLKRREIRLPPSPRNRAQVKHSLAIQCFNHPQRDDPALT